MWGAIRPIRLWCARMQPSLGQPHMQFAAPWGDDVKLFHFSALAGGVVWLLLFLVPVLDDGDMGAIARLLLFGPLVLVPLALGLVAVPSRQGKYSRPLTLARILQAPAAACAVASFFVRAEVLAALLVTPWVLFTLCVGLYGLARLLSRGFTRMEETCIAVGLLYLPVGGGWLLLSRLGVNPLGFGDTIVLLTAVHFHYAGFVTPLLAGMAGRTIPHACRDKRLVFRFVSLAVIAGPALVAAGITTSPMLELTAVVLLAAGLVALAALMLALAAQPNGSIPRGLLILSALSPLITMTLALAYGVGEFTGRLVVSVSHMVQLHGWINALGFALCGLMGWLLVMPPARVSPPGIPFSRLAGKRRIGPGFFVAINAIPLHLGSPAGLVEKLAEYDGPHFSALRVHANIRNFYEQTGRCRLRVYPRWRRGFRLGARLYRKLSRAVGQMNLPLKAEAAGEEIESRIVPLDDSQDGRTLVRGWVRTYEETGEAVYVAAYAHHTWGQHTYMNIAFPLPGGNLTSILRLEEIRGDGGENGLLLTTLPTAKWVGDEGVYYVHRLGILRLPFNETISVWAPGMAGIPAELKEYQSLATTVLARHEVGLFGIKFLTLDYAISAES